MIFIYLLHRENLWRVQATGEKAKPALEGLKFDCLFGSGFDERSTRPKRAVQLELELWPPNDRTHCDAGLLTTHTLIFIQVEQGGK